jgi:receptor expression-enhancing protein 5/6
MLYPIFKSIQATNSLFEEDQKQWLSYWIIFSFTTFWEWTGGIVLSYILPVFWLWKLLFWIWLMAP